tara:strand:+ start:750 stop:1835 length:1086 start_codon:yes stop_codon:yes gene_type:complete
MPTGPGSYNADGSPKLTPGGELGPSQGIPAVDDALKSVLSFFGAPTVAAGSDPRVSGAGILPQSVQVGNNSATPPLGIQAPQQDPIDEGGSMDYLGNGGKVAANAGNTKDYDATIALQRQLNSLGADLAMDGINGPLTKAAQATYLGSPTDAAQVAPASINPQQTSEDPFDLDGSGAVQPSVESPQAPVTDEVLPPDTDGNPLTMPWAELFTGPDQRRREREQRISARGGGAPVARAISAPESSESANQESAVGSVTQNVPPPRQGPSNPLDELGDALPVSDNVPSDLAQEQRPGAISDVLSAGDAALRADVPDVPDRNEDVEQAELIKSLVANGDMKLAEQIMQNMPPERATVIMELMAK